VAGVCREQSAAKLDAFKGRITVIPGATDDREVIERAVAGCHGVLTVLVPRGVDNYSSGTAQAVLDYARPGARLVFSCGWHITRDGQDDFRVMLSAVNTKLGERWRLERRLDGGWNEGAYLLSRPDGSRAVLKWRTSEPERLLGARERVDAARARGWPAPAWLAAGRAPAGGAWVVQEFIDGRPPPS
jgi:hypothetical protein